MALTPVVQHDCSSKWTKLSRFPCTHFPRPLPSEDASFIIAPFHSKKHNRYQENGIWSYDINDDKWTQIIPYPPDLITENHSAALDSKQQILYIYGPQSNLYRFDLSTNTQLSPIINCRNVGCDPVLEFANDSLHIIGGEENGYHLRWNKVHESLENSKSDFESMHSFCSLIHHGVVFIHRLQSLYSFGGKINHGPNFDVICTLNVNDDSWSHLNVKLPFPICQMGIVSVLHEKYVLIIGGFGVKMYQGTRFDSIFIFDLEAGIFYRSAITLPKEIKGWCHAVIPNNRKWYNSLVIGYVKSIWECDGDGDDSFPQCLVEVIIDLLEEKQVHVLRVGTGDHYRISVHDILEEKTVMLFRYDT